MKSGELYRERRWEFLAAVNECASQTETAARLGASMEKVRYAAVKLGIELPRGQPGLPAGHGEQDNGRRIISMVAARKKGATYQEIGEQWGLTRERVRQILKRARPELCGSAQRLGLKKYTLYKFACERCGKKFKRKLPNPRRYCSWRCSGKAKRKNDRAAAIYRTRMDGRTWAEAGRAFYGADVTQPDSRAIGAVKRWAEYTGKDVSQAFGRRLVE